MHFIEDVCMAGVAAQHIFHSYENDEYSVVIVSGRRRRRRHHRRLHWWSSSVEKHLAKYSHDSHVQFNQVTLYKQLVIIRFIQIRLWEIAPQTHTRTHSHTHNEQTTFRRSFTPS